MSKNTDLGSLINYVKGQITGRLNAPAYTSATAFTGTIAGYLGFDTSGNILTSTGSGVGGSGTINYIPKFTASGTIGNSQIYDDGTSIDIGNTNGSVGKLNVTGRIALTSSLFFSSNLTSEDRWEINVATPANDLYFSRSGVGERLRITSGGNLGVGTTTPFSDTNFVSTYIGGSSGGQLILGNSTGGSANRYMLLQGDSTAASLLAIGAIPLIFYTNGNERIRITSAGNLAIGITTAISPLTIQATSGGAGIRLVGRSVSNQDNEISFIANNNSTVQAYITTSNAGMDIMTVVNQSMRFHTNNTERMRIDESGRFGLGTTSTSGYAMTVTGVDGTDYSPSALYKITTKFINNTSENKGIGIGYHTNQYVNTACIYSLSQGSAAYPQSGIAFGVYNYSTSAYVIRFLITETTVKITNIPTSVSGLGTGDLYRDGSGFVKIAF